MVVQNRPGRVPGLPGQQRGPPPLDTSGDAGAEHRQFPRAKLAVPFSLSIGEAADARFRATLTSVNLSVSGAFLESTFFLPLGTQLRVSFELEGGEAPVEALAEIVRIEHPGRDGKGRSGLAIRFGEFFQQSEVTLAKLFLGLRLRAFAEAYLASKRARTLTNELDRTVDALAAWELQKVGSAQSAWEGL